jgi:hypothetical protein
LRCFPKEVTLRSGYTDAVDVIVKCV